MAGIEWKTERIRIGELVEWEKNPVQLTEHEAGEIRKSLKRFGLVLPLVANAPVGGGRRRLIDGHQRKHVEEAARVWTEDTEVDVRVPSRVLTERECDELAIRLRQNTGKWDFDLLANNFELEDLFEWGFTPRELELGGFDLDGDGAVGVEEEELELSETQAEALQERWRVQVGDLWSVGRHRVLCDDCTDAEAVARVMGGERADITITDPPYNVGIKYTDRTNDRMSKEEYIKWCAGWTRHLPKRHLLSVGIKRLCWWDEILGDPQWIIAWVKRNGQGQTGLCGTNKWDAILIYGVEPDKGIDLVEVSNDYSENIKSSGGHPVARPVALWRLLLERFGRRGEVVYEPFLGSGTTAIAAEQLGMASYGIEIEPRYVAVSLERLRLATGAQPVLMRNNSSEPLGV
jgi:hypothetical protein